MKTFLEYIQRYHVDLYEVVYKKNEQFTYDEFVEHKWI